MHLFYTGIFSLDTVDSSLNIVFLMKFPPSLTWSEMAKLDRPSAAVTVQYSSVQYSTHYTTLHLSYGFVFTYSFGYSFALGYGYCQ